MVGDKGGLAGFGGPFSTTNWNPGSSAALEFFLLDEDPSPLVTLVLRPLEWDRFGDFNGVPESSRDEFSDASKLAGTGPCWYTDALWSRWPDPSFFIPVSQAKLSRSLKSDPALPVGVILSLRFGVAEIGRAGRTLSGRFGAAFELRRFPDAAPS